ncbi:hypothetical protein ACQ3G6_01505 [Allorhizobium undicola]|uniref:hypothetical protein n=1 Tax=Allorhizobium undicola TaxID=78527 RepID=UPI003D33B52E
MVNSVESSSSSKVETDSSSNFLNYSDLVKNDNAATSTRKVDPNNRYEGLSAADQLTKRYLDRDRSAGDALPGVDASAYADTVAPTSVSQADVKLSEYWMGRAKASDTYTTDLATLENTKFSLLKDAMAGVDRAFVNPASVKDIASLTTEQKAALLIDLSEIKAQFNAYMDQYGDSVPDGESAGKAIDERIDALSKDSATASYMEELTARVLKDYVARPENAEMKTRLEMTFMEDIVGGKAVDRALAAGKSKEDALVDYSSELKTLTSILPEDFTRDMMGAANATLASMTNDMLIGDGTAGDLSAFAAGANGTNAAIEPVVKAMLLTFLGENAGNSKMFGPAIQSNYAQDITRNFNSVITLMRSGMKVDDALASVQRSFSERPAPLGLDNDIYKAGIAHAVQALASSAVLVSRSLGTGQTWQPQDIAGAMANAVQIVGLTTEGLAKNLDAAGKPFSMFGTGSGSWGRTVSSLINPKNLEAGGKIIGGIGGLATAGLSFFSASRSLKAGEEPRAALEILTGAAAVANSLIGFSEVAIQLTNVVPRVFSAAAVTSSEFIAQATNALKVGLSVAGTITGLVASLAGMGLGIWDMVKGVKKLDEMEAALNDRLEKYLGISVHLEIGPDPSFVW